MCAVIHDARSAHSDFQRCQCFVMGERPCHEYMKEVYLLCQLPVRCYISLMALDLRGHWHLDEFTQAETAKVGRALRSDVLASL
jgi:hypothetical protein